jgi:hypothetical protein
MRSGWAPDAHHLIFDVGPLGCPLSAAHGHADLLSVQASAFGEPFLVDPGTGVYADETRRTFFRSTAAHSTVTIDGESQAVPAGRFAWRQRPRAWLTRWVSVEAFDFAEAEHDGYVRLPGPVRHRRRVLFVKPRYWVLVDDLEGVGTHKVDVRFQFGPMTVSLERDLWARARGARSGLLVRPFSTVPLDGFLRRGASQPMEGWVSPDYGQQQPAHALVYSAEASLPLRVVTLLLPCADPAAPAPTVRARVGTGSVPVELVFEPNGDAVCFDGRDGVRLRPGPATITS